MKTTVSKVKEKKSLEELLEDQEEVKLEKFIKEYIKQDLNEYQAYVATFPRTLYKDEKTAKDRASALIKRTEALEIIDEKYNDLREIYKEEITNSFKLLNNVIKDDTYVINEIYYDFKTKRPIEYSGKKSYNIKDKLKAAEILLKVFGYMDKQEINIKVENNEYEIVKKIGNIKGSKDE